MSEIFGYSELEVLVMLLIGGGVIIFLVGLVLPVSSSYGPELRGYRRHKPVMPVGAWLCILGVILGFSFNIFW